MISAVWHSVPGPEIVHVEVAYAEPDRQFLRSIELTRGATVTDAIRASNIEEECAITANDLLLGIWSRPVPPETVLVDGDRVELYRPLKIDPKEGRRKRAKNRSR